jgi:hypothetical protein
VTAGEQAAHAPGTEGCCAARHFDHAAGGQSSERLPSYLIDLLEKGQIPQRKVGTHRRVLFRDVMAYKHKTDAARLKALDDLSALDQELGGLGNKR